MENLLLRNEAISCVKRILNKETEVSNKTLNAMKKIQKQFIDNKNCNLRTPENIELLSDCFSEKMSKEARQEYIVLYETICSMDKAA